MTRIFLSVCSFFLFLYFSVAFTLFSLALVKASKDMRLVTSRNRTDPYARPKVGMKRKPPKIGWKFFFLPMTYMKSSKRVTGLPQQIKPKNRVYSGTHLAIKYAAAAASTPMTVVSRAEDQFLPCWRI